SRCRCTEFHWAHCRTCSTGRSRHATGSRCPSERRSAANSIHCQSAVRYCETQLWFDEFVFSRDRSLCERILDRGILRRGVQHGLKHSVGASSPGSGEISFMTCGSSSKNFSGMTHLVSPEPPDGAGNDGVFVQSLVFILPSNSLKGKTTTWLSND